MGTHVSIQASAALGAANRQQLAVFTPFFKSCNLGLLLMQAPAAGADSPAP